MTKVSRFKTRSIGLQHNSSFYKTTDANNFSIISYFTERRILPSFANSYFRETSERPAFTLVCHATGGQALTSILADGEAVTRLPAVHATQSTASNNRNAACFRDQSVAAWPGQRCCTRNVTTLINSAHLAVAVCVPRECTTRPQTRRVAPVERRMKPTP